jgi:phosphatidylglycerophosphate synthase
VTTPPTDGEQWAREALERLREDRFTPQAISRFLVASHRRAREARAARPALARQSRAWTGIGAGAWCALAAMGAQPYRRRLGGGLASWGAVALMLEWHLGMVETEDGDPRRLGPADALTLLRAWLIPAVADDLDPRLVAIAAATDALDGMAARATRPTRAGRDLEGLVDAALCLAALRTAARTRRLSRVAIAIETIRLAAGVGYAAGVYFAYAEPPDPSLTRAARRTAPLRAGGFAAAGAGRRRCASALLTAGSLCGLVTLWLSARDEAGLPRATASPREDAR